jgi:Repeat of unknown function (DUF6923)
VSVDTRGRRAAQDLIRAAGQRGPVPELDRLRRRHRHRRLGRAGLAVAAVIVLGAVVAQALPALERGAPGPVPPVATPATTRTWPGVPGLDRHVRDTVATGKAQLAEVAAGPSGVWVLNRRHGTPDDLVRVDPATDAVLARLEVNGVVSILAVGEDGGVWLYRTAMTPVRPELVRVDPSTNRVADTIALPPGPPGTPAGASALQVAGGSVWLADQHNRLFQVDPASRQVREVTDGGRSLAVDHLAYAGGWVWGTRGLLLYRIDPRTGTVTMTVNNPDLHNAMPASGLAGGAGQLWLYGHGGTGRQVLHKLSPADGRLLATRQLSSRTDQTGVLAAGDRVVAVRSGRRLLLSDSGGTVRATVPVPEAQGGLAVGPAAVWVADPARGRLLRVDPGF